MVKLYYKINFCEIIVTHLRCTRMYISQKLQKVFCIAIFKSTHCLYYNNANYILSSIII